MEWYPWSSSLPGRHGSGSKPSTTLFAAITLAAETGCDAFAWQLPSAMGTFLDRRGRWHEWVTADRTALKAATRLSDKTGQAHATFLLGLARIRLADYGQAHPDLAESLELYRQLGDLSRQARVHQSLCCVATLQGAVMKRSAMPSRHSRCPAQSLTRPCRPNMRWVLANITTTPCTGTGPGAVLPD